MRGFLFHGALIGVVNPGESSPLPIATESRALAVVDAPTVSATLEPRRRDMSVNVSIWDHSSSVDVEALARVIDDRIDLGIVRIVTQIRESENHIVAVVTEIGCKLHDEFVAARSARGDSDAIVGEEDGPIDLQRLGQQFLDEELKDEVDKAKKSTFKSAFGYWWKTIGLDVYPHDGKIEDFGVICRRAASEDYALARQRVMRKFREWLEARDIRRSPNESVTPNAPITSSGNARGIPDVAVPENYKWIVQITRDAIFGGEPSEDYWATLVRHVASDIGASGIARMCGVDEEMAERWIQLRKIPKIAREKLKYANLLLEIRKAKVEGGKDLDDLWDEALEVEGFISSGLGQDGL